jgi:Leucine-rich repeat (LRR) protein
MVKEVIAFIVAILSAPIVASCCKESPEVLIADPVFEAYCLIHFDKNGNGVIQRNEVKRIKSLNISNLNIQSLKGIEDFLSLEHLNCNNNHLTRLFLSKNRKLTTVYCAQNELLKLDVSENVKLHTLDCSNNQITMLNVSGNKALTSLNCHYNPLEIIHVWEGFDTKKYSRWSTPEDATCCNIQSLDNMHSLR